MSAHTEMLSTGTCPRCGHPADKHRRRHCDALRMWVPNGKGSPHSLCGCEVAGADTALAAASWNAFMGRT